MPVEAMPRRKVEQRLQRATVLGFALILAGPAAAWLLGRTAADLAPPERMGAQLLLHWLVAVALLVLVVCGERRSLTSIGTKPPRISDPVVALAGFAAMSAVVYVSMPLVAMLGAGTLESGVRHLSRISIPLRFAAAITAGITEEIVYRGFLVERLISLTDRPGRASSISWALFTALHVPSWGIGGSVQIGLASIVIYFVYLRRRSLLPCILLHVANDLYAFLIVPLMMPEFP